jgi:hypothetical protein
MRSILLLSVLSLSTFALANGEPIIRTCDIQARPFRPFDCATVGQPRFCLQEKSESKKADCQHERDLIIALGKSDCYETIKQVKQELKSDFFRNLFEGSPLKAEQLTISVLHNNKQEKIHDRLPDTWNIGQIDSIANKLPGDNYVVIANDAWGNKVDKKELEKAKAEHKFFDQYLNHLDLSRAERSKAEWRSTRSQYPNIGTCKVLVSGIATRKLFIDFEVDRSAVIQSFRNGLTRIIGPMKEWKTQKIAQEKNEKRLKAKEQLKKAQMERAIAEKAMKVEAPLAQQAEAVDGALR